MKHFTREEGDQQPEKDIIAAGIRRPAVVESTLRAAECRDVAAEIEVGQAWLRDLTSAA